MNITLCLMTPWEPRQTVQYRWTPSLAALSREQDTLRMGAVFGCPQSDEAQAAQVKLAFAAVLLQIWAHPVLCYHKTVRGKAHPNYPLRGNAARFSADVFKGQRQQRVTSEDGDIFSIHLHMQ